MIEMETRAYNRRQGALSSASALPLDAMRGLGMGMQIREKWDRIAREQGRPNSTADNDIDARRHSEWHQSMAAKFGPKNAVRIGDLYEDPARFALNLKGRYGPHERAAAQMDRYNNRAGAQTVISGRQLSPGDLQQSPTEPARILGWAFTIPTGAKDRVGEWSTAYRRP